MANFILAIDQGTTGSTAMLMDENGQAVTKVNEEFPQIFPQPGWVEHDPEAIWKSVENTCSRAISEAGVNPSQIAAIGITNQRETVVLWDRETGKPVYNAIVWQCRRTDKYCKTLRDKKFSRKIKNKTGLVIDPYFSASKIRWILKNIPECKALHKQHRLMAGTIDTFLLWRLTGGQSHKTDVSNASRTMLMNINSGRWDGELLNLFSVPESILPEISPSSGEFGKTAKLNFLPDGIPISGIAGDQQAALFGQSCFKVSDSKCTFGTGSFLLMNTGDKLTKSKAGLLSTVAWQLKDEPMKYALEGGAFICGAAVQWLRDELQIIEKASQIEELAAQVSDTGGVEFVPALTGMGSPHWDAEARGVISGLTRGSGRAHIARATLEGMALQNAEILNAMQKDLGKKMKKLRVDGGACANNLLMQTQADYLGVQIDRPRMIETTSAGAAYLAGLGVGVWTDLADIEKIWQIDKTFIPEMKTAARKKRFASWELAVKRAKVH